MKIIELDLAGAKTLNELHERIRVAFGFPEWYGKNWDAFNDLLCTDCDANKVVIKGENTLSKEFEKSLDMMHRVFELKIKFNKELKFDEFSYEIIS